MTPAVIDASVAVKWFFDEQVGSKEALALLSEIEKNPRAYIVPELFFNEMVAVFCRAKVRKELSVRYVRLLEELGFHRVGNGSELLASAMSLSLEFSLSGYDALYAATAQLVSGIWITADARAHQKIEKLGISRLL